ncbi:MAG: TatD family hydrolase [Treponema sp.]|nr:TatD family hydrolase [Treponema sp.]
METVYTDTHAHVEKFAESLGEEGAKAVLAAFADANAIAGANATADANAAAGVKAGDGNPALLLDPGTDVDDLPRRIALAAGLLGIAPDADGRFALPPWLHFAAGVWPGRPALDDPDASMKALRASIAAAGRQGVRVSAIGECGFDFHHMEADEKTQLRLFSAQIELAVELGLPLIVHSRDAAKATLDALGAAGVAGAAARDIPVIIHCFGYGPEEVRAFLDSGAWISFAGNLTYKKSEPLREALAIVPDDRLLLETDAPYMNPEPRRGKASSPLDVVRTYEKAAALRGTTARALADKVSANAFGLFAPRL